MKFLFHFFLLIMSFLTTDLKLCAEEYQNESEKEKKILVLIIASDGEEFYVELQKLWRSYMHYDPEHVEAYFIKGDPNLETTFEIRDDVIWSQTVENFVPGIWNKTVLSMEALLPRIDEFDYVLRTNLSSFYIFPRLLKFLETLPKTKGVCAIPLFHWIPFPSGAGYLLSIDVVKLIVNKKELALADKSAPDDIVLGRFLHAEQLSMIPYQRTDFLTLDQWLAGKDKIPDDFRFFHFRLKNTNQENRLTEEVYIYQQLIDMFYR